MKRISKAVLLHCMRAFNTMARLSILERLIVIKWMKGESAMGTKHPGFKSVAKSIEKEGYSKKAAGAILAAKTRGASAKAKKANPRLKKVKG